MNNHRGALALERDRISDRAKEACSFAINTINTIKHENSCYVSNGKAISMESYSSHDEQVQRNEFVRRILARVLKTLNLVSKYDQCSFVLNKEPRRRIKTSQNSLIRFSR